MNAREQSAAFNWLAAFVFGFFVAFASGDPRWGWVALSGSFVLYRAAINARS